MTSTRSSTRGRRRPGSGWRRLEDDQRGGRRAPVLQVDGLETVFHTRDGRVHAVNGVSFELHTDDLAFHGRDGRRVVEPGLFHAWLGGSSDIDLHTSFRIVESGT